VRAGGPAEIDRGPGPGQRSTPTPSRCSPLCGCALSAPPQSLATLAQGGDVVAALALGDVPTEESQPPSAEQAGKVVDDVGCQAGQQGDAHDLRQAAHEDLGQALVLLEASTGQLPSGLDFLESPTSAATFARMRLAPLAAFSAAAMLSSGPAPAELAYYAHPSSLSAVAARFHLARFHLGVAEIAALNGIKDPNRFHREGLVLPDTSSTRQLPRYVPWTPAPPRATCPTTAWTLRPAQRRGCVEAYCGTGPDGETGCLCKDERSGLKLEIAPPGGAPAKIPIDLSVFNPFGSSMVDIASVDLDGDGKKEILASWLTAVSNGLGQEFRTLVVLKDRREVLRYDSGEHTAGSAAVRVGGQCHLASSHYEEATHPLRGPALYLTERTFDPVSMRMDEEIVGRRASDRTRFVLPFDPLVGDAREPRGERGTIAAVHRDVGGWLDRLSLRTKAATRAVKVDEPGDPDGLRLGDAVTRRVFPMGLQWEGLTGRSARLVKRASWEARRMLWIGR
jgi:hypothetical protein